MLQSISNRVGDLSTRASALGSRPERVRAKIPFSRSAKNPNASNLHLGAGQYNQSSHSIPLNLSLGVLEMTNFGTINGRLDSSDPKDGFDRRGVGDARRRSVHPTAERLNGSLWRLRPLAKTSSPMEKSPQLLEKEPLLS